MDYTVNDLKRRFRKLKALEITLRYGEAPPASPLLIWNHFFDLSESCRRNVKYPLETLSKMSSEECRRAIAEYLSYVYNDLFGENRLPPSLLMKWGLPANADGRDIKKKFRELAMQAHPDTGGSDEAFVKLMEEYKNAVRQNNRLMIGEVR